MHLTRRYFLQMSGSLAAYVGVCPFNILRGQDAGVVRKGQTLVVLFLRGGADGLNMVIPYGDKQYASQRKSITIPEDAAIDLDGFFALHPRLKDVAPFFKLGYGVAVHAVGHDKNTRSHFEEQDVWETGMTGNTINSDGWLNRHLSTSEGRGPVRALAIGDTLPRIFHGKANVCAIGGVEQLTLSEGRTDRAKLAAALEYAYQSEAKKEVGAARDLLAQTGQATLEGIKAVQGLVASEYKADAPYPDSDLARKLMQAARLIKANVGLEVVEIDYDGWDTHQGQGAVEGTFADLVGGLGEALGAFMKDLGSRLDDVLIVTLSDFGRTVAENGTNGTDHGWGNCLLAFGGSVKRRAGKKEVLGHWPGLAVEQLKEGRDLAHTTDFRDVLAELVRVQLGNPNLEKVLPNHTFKPVGVIG